MAQTLIYNSHENLSEWVDKRYVDLANQALKYYYYYVGEPLDIFELLLTESMYSILTSGEIDDCIACNIGRHLDRYKSGYCEDNPLVSICENTVS